MQNSSLSIIIVGASGNLARKKVLPALFSLYCQGFLPDDFNIFGYSRSVFSDELFRSRIMENLACRYVPGEHECAEQMENFIKHCFYVSGEYNKADGYLDLYQVMKEHESSAHTNRLFYLSIPPEIFSDVARAIGDAGYVRCGVHEPWSRVVVEKPFGRDRKSSDALTRELSQVFSEEQTFRIDHYLGKEVIQNLLVLRFANLVFEPVWNGRYVEKVEITWKEKNGVDGRGGYFDNYGIIRDVMQNHLLQILALMAMEPPRSMGAEHIMREKINVLRLIKPLALKDMAIGQYVGCLRDDKMLSGYREDPTVADDSITPTFAIAVLKIPNDRWRGVPFIIRAGKGLDESLNEIRIKFKAVTDCLFCGKEACPDSNELIIRVQPDEAINLRIVNKVPGVGIKFDTRDLDLRYRNAYKEIIPEAYESLILDVLEGDKSLFIGCSELEAAWDIFTPVLDEMELMHLEPLSYELGSIGPDVSKVYTDTGSR